MPEFGQCGSEALAGDTGAVSAMAATATEAANVLICTGKSFLVEALGIE